MKVARLFHVNNDSDIHRDLDLNDSVSRAINHCSTSDRSSTTVELVTDVEKGSRLTLVTT